MANLEFILKNNLVKNLEFAVPEYLVDSEKNVIGQLSGRTGRKYIQVVTNNDFRVLDKNFVNGVLETLQQENFIELRVPIDTDEWNWLEMTIKMWGGLGW